MCILNQIKQRVKQRLEIHWNCNNIRARHVAMMIFATNETSKFGNVTNLHYSLFSNAIKLRCKKDMHQA